MAFLALGLDPKRAILFRQSDIPEVTELYWILGTVVPLVEPRARAQLQGQDRHGASPRTSASSPTRC